MKPRIEENILICPKCGFTEAKNEIKTIPLIEQSGASLKIVESEKGPSALPTTSIDCPKCGNKKVLVPSQLLVLIVPNVETT